RGRQRGRRGRRQTPARDRAEGESGAGMILALVALLLAGCASAGAPGGGSALTDASPREEVHSVSVFAVDAKIVVTTYRPRAWGPFPWIVMSHGTAPTPEANRTIGRYRSLNPIREWVRRGYAVIVPVRRGYGASGGAKFGDSYGTCSTPDFRRAGEGAALDLLATIEWAKAQRDLDAKRWLLGARRAGGVTHIS